VCGCVCVCVLVLKHHTHEVREIYNLVPVLLILSDFSSRLNIMQLKWTV